MPNVNAAQFLNATRTIKVPLTFEEGDERRTEEFTVKYRSYSPRVAREMAEAEADENNRNMAKSLAKIIVSIPEILDGEKPIAITEENLNEMSTDNLNALYRGVLADVSPTERPTSEASPVISPPEAGEA
jgi:hypothetical protein